MCGVFARSPGGGASLRRYPTYDVGRGIPIGNLTSQLFANVYLDGLDHYAKEVLRLPCYLRYADDVTIVGRDPVALQTVLPSIRAWLWDERRLELHPRKMSLRKLSWGIDFLGYVTLPRHRILRTKTKRRMFVRVCMENIASYLGLLRHCSGWRLRQRLFSLMIRARYGE
ncbi:MAG: RNA-directed DNA polymerase [bacterium]|nr:RNA-directed DNA polymerase [bacterium]